MATTGNGKIRDFIIIWQGQLMSIIGSGLTSFALGVWVYQTTGLATLYGMIILLATLPGVLIKPLAGIIADRFNRRAVILLSDFGASLGTLFIAIMIWTNHFEIWQIYLGVGFSSLCNGIQTPAYQAAVTQIVPKNFYGQAAGMIQAASSGTYLFSPLIAGVLMGIIGIENIILIDFATFIYAVVMMLIIKVPAPEKTTEGSEGAGHIGVQMMNGFKYLKSRSGLLTLLGIFFINNFLLGFLIVLIGPMILSFASPQILGLGESISAIGMLISSVLVAILGVPKRLVKNIFLFFLISGISYGLIGVRANYYLIIVPCFIFFAALPIINACIDTLFRKKVVQDMQGRVFAIVGMVTQTGSILSYTIAGPLADKVFEPLLLKGGLLADNIGKIIGIGPGRGIGFIFILTGLTIALVSLISYSLPRVKSLETELPDAIQCETELSGVI
jgi:DHA3 family macrolide efflux protein-like MFS transporter